MHYDSQLELILARDTSLTGIWTLLSHKLSNNVEKPMLLYLER